MMWTLEEKKHFLPRQGTCEFRAGGAIFFTVWNESNCRVQPELEEESLKHGVQHPCYPSWFLRTLKKKSPGYWSGETRGGWIRGGGLWKVWLGIHKLKCLTLIGVILRGWLGESFQTQGMEVILTLVADCCIRRSYHFLNRSWMSVRSGWQQVNCYPGRSGNTAFDRQELGKKEGGMWAGRGKGREKDSILPDHHQQKIQLPIF